MDQNKENNEKRNTLMQSYLASKQSRKILIDPWNYEYNLYKEVKGKV